MIQSPTIEQILDNLHDGLYFVDRDRTITYWNKAAERITGYRADEVIGFRCADNILMHVDAQGNALCKGMCPLGATISDGKARDTEVFLHHKKGHRVPVWVRVSPLLNDEKEIVGGIELFTDISPHEALRLRIEELEQLALIDPLTQLPNRRHMESQIQSFLAERKRTELSFGVLFMDLDYLKQCNDQYGHKAGDLVLQTVANTFSSVSRPFDIIGRWGGDEFLGVFRNVDLPVLTNIGERLRLLVEHSCAHTDKADITVTISLGGTLVRNNDTQESIVERADSLMYRSKENGRNRLTMG